MVDFVSPHSIKTIYGQVDGTVLTEIPSGGRYHLNGIYLKLKPTWFNLSYDRTDRKYNVLKVFELVEDMS
jgi:hypothetical protein